MYFYVSDILKFFEIQSWWCLVQTVSTKHQSSHNDSYYIPARASRAPGRIILDGLDEKGNYKKNGIPSGNIILLYQIVCVSKEYHFFFMEHNVEVACLVIGSWKSDFETVSGDLLDF
jgi:hypothetical protein